MARKRLKSDMGWSTVDRITVRGKDLPGEILGHLNLGDMAFLELTGRVPSAGESKIFNAMVVTLVEHGITPSAIVARLTYLGAPEALQAAVAGGLLGLGSVFVGSMEGVARILAEAVANGKDAATVLAENKSQPIDQASAIPAILSAVKGAFTLAAKHNSGERKSYLTGRRCRRRRKTGSSRSLPCTFRYRWRTSRR